jgi:Bacterial Ig-like domain
VPITGSVHRRLAIIASLLAALAPAAVPASAVASFAPASACPGAQPGDITAAADTTAAPSAWGAAPLNVTFTATGADHLEWRLDCGAPQSVAPGTTIGISAADGTHVLSHRAVDGSGMATAWTDDTIGIDSSAPTNTTVTPSGWTEPPVTVDVTGTDLYSGVDHVESNLDGNGVQSGPSGTTVTVTGDGTHSLATQIVDAAGNRSSLRTDTIQVDGTAPTDNTVVPTGWQSTAPTVTVTGSDALSGIQRVEWKLDGTLSSGADGATVTIPDGTHSFDTRVIDGAGNASAWAPHTVQVDVSGPSDDTTVPSSWQTAPVTVTVTGSDDKSSIDHVEWKLDGVSGSGPNGSVVHVSSDGVHTLQTRIANSAGEISPWKTQYVDVDTLVPNDDTAAPSGWQTAPLTVDVTGDDATSGIQHVEWQIDGGATQQSTTNGNPVAISAEGQHTLATRVVDAAGLASPWHNHAIRIDTTSPVNETPVGSSAWRASDYAVVLDGADSGSGLSEMRWQIDGGPVHSGPPLTQVTVSGTGAHTLTTWAVDVAGNASGHRDDHINIDTVPPTDTTSVPAGPVANNSTVTVTGTDAHSGIAQVEWQLDGNPVQTTPTATLTGGGTHTLKTQVIDGAGNLSGWTSHTVTVSGTDSTPPVDTSTTVTASWYTDPVTVTVSATDPDTGVQGVQWRVDGTGLHSGASGSTVTMSGDGVHELETRATNNASPALTSTWRVQYVDIDTTLPTDTTALPTGWSNSTSFTLNGTDATSGVKDVEYEIDGATTPSTVAAGGAVTVSGDGTHTIRHRVIDNAEQATPWTTDTVKVDTTRPVNTTPAAPTGWQTSPLALALSGTDADSGVARYEWRVDGGATQTGTQADVSADGVHTLETRVVDVAGNASDWRPESVQVDTTAPENTTPAPPAPWQTDPYTVTVSATDPTSGLDHVEWRVDGGAVQTTPTVTISTPGPHVLETRAIDTAGNASDWRSDSIGIDQTVPTLTASCGAGAWINRPATCAVTADGGDSGIATLTATRGTGTPEDVHGGAYTVTADGEWPLTFRAVDGAGNATTATATVRVDRSAPQVHVSCVPDAATSYTCSASATDSLSGVANYTYAVNGGPAQVTAGTFTVAHGTVVVRAADHAGNVGVAPALTLADRTPPPPPPPPAPKPKPKPTPAPAPQPNPRSSSAAVFGAGGHTRSRLLGELSVASLPTRTTVDVRPLALGSGRFQVELKVTADRTRKTVHKTLTLRHGYSPRIRVRVGGAFSVSVKLTVRRWSGHGWVTFATGSARL